MEYKKKKKETIFLGIQQILIKHLLCADSGLAHFMPPQNFMRRLGSQQTSLIFSATCLAQDTKYVVWHLGGLRVKTREKASTEAVEQQV